MTTKRKPITKKKKPVKIIGLFGKTTLGQRVWSKKRVYIDPPYNRDDPSGEISEWEDDISREQFLDKIIKTIPQSYKQKLTLNIARIYFKNSVNHNAKTYFAKSIKACPQAKKTFIEMGIKGYKELWGRFLYKLLEKEYITPDQAKMWR
jgi:hypothetical protein